MKTQASLKRFIEEIAFSERFQRQMRFIAGPRQTGKTTIACRQLEASGCSGLYFNWDKKEVRNRYRREPNFLAAEMLKIPAKETCWVCFDEIHKRTGWKNILKDFFDTHERKVRFIVTGSARLDLFRRAGDSLAGRYFLFKLNPLMLAEVLSKSVSEIMPEEDAGAFLEKMVAGKKEKQKEFEQLLEFGGFPEPFLAADPLFSKKWKEDYFERVVKEDLRDLSRIHDLEKVLDLIFLLPERIGSPLSVNSLREDLEVNFQTAKNYLKYLVLTYVLFEMPPYSQRSPSLIKKEKKVYFYDWTVAGAEASRFENYAAIELKSRVDLWNDTLQESYGLFYVRTRDGLESDFLITRNAKPWLLLEAKLSDTGIARHHYHHSQLLRHIPFIQLVKSPGVLKVAEKKFYTVSAARFFG